MTPTSASLLNMTAGHSNTTTKPHDSDLCAPFSNAHFETLDSSAPYIVNASLNVPLAIVTTFANLLVLLAMRHVTTIRLPSKLLLSSLVLTDLGAGLVVQPQFAVRLFIMKDRVHCLLIKSYSFSGSLFSCASLLTMTAISLDRYTALFYHLKYQQIVTTRRVSAVLTFTWSLALCFSFASLWNNVLWNVFMRTALITGVLVISVACVKIYRRLRDQHGHQVQDHDQAQQQAGNTLNMAKYRKTASAMMWIYVLFVICYLPFCCTNVVIAATEETALAGCIWEFSFTLVLLNSCLNPFVYCLRLPEIRTEVKKNIRKFCCRSPPQ